MHIMRLAPVVAREQPNLAAGEMSTWQWVAVQEDQGRRSA